MTESAIADEILRSIDVVPRFFLFSGVSKTEAAAGDTVAGPFRRRTIVVVDREVQPLVLYKSSLALMI